MEKVAGGGRSAGSHRQHRLGACAVLAVCGAACLPSWAQQAPQAADTAVAQARIDQPRLQVQSNNLPRFGDVQDAGPEGPRVNLTLYPSHSGLGAMVGMNGFAQPAAAPGPANLQPGSSVDVGVRFSQRVQSQQVDIMAWRRVNTEDDAYTLLQRQPMYGARVEMNLAAGRKSLLGFDHGHLGLQLEGGAHISIKRSNGHPMVYYRTTF